MIVPISAKCAAHESSFAGLPLGVTVALETDKGTLYGAAAVSQFIALQSKASASLSAADHRVQEWLQWSANVATGPVSDMLQAAEKGAKFPLDSVAANAALLATDEQAAGMSLYVSASH